SVSRYLIVKVVPCASPFKVVHSGWRGPHAPSTKAKAKNEKPRTRRDFSEIRSIRLPTEVVEADILLWDAPVVAHLQHGGVHHGRAAEVELDVLGSLVLLQVLIDHGLVHEAGEAVALGIVHVLLHLPVVIGVRLAEHHEE